MTQRELNDAVCFSTGDDLREIRRHGFSLADPAEVHFDPEPDQLPPSVVDWDELDLLHNCTWSAQRSRERDCLIGS